jgi:hypothetical protein
MGEGGGRRTRRKRRSKKKKGGLIEEEAGRRCGAARWVPVHKLACQYCSDSLATLTLGLGVVACSQRACVLGQASEGARMFVGAFSVIVFQDHTLLTIPGREEARIDSPCSGGQTERKKER